MFFFEFIFLDKRAEKTLARNMNRRIPVENLRPIDGALFFNMNLKKKNICPQFFENVASEEIGGKLW